MLSVYGENLDVLPLCLSLSFEEVLLMDYKNIFGQG